VGIILREYKFEDVGLSEASSGIRDEVLVTLAQSGSHRAFAELFRRHQKTLAGVVQRITRNVEDTEDAVQDSSLKAFVNIQTFDGKSAFSTWLVRIGINTALMMLRKRRRTSETSIDDHTASDLHGVQQITECSKNPEMELLDRETHLRVHAAIGRLPAPLRTIMELHILQDLTIRELARTAGISEAATKSRLYRARAALRRSILCKRKQDL